MCVWGGGGRAADLPTTPLAGAHLPGGVDEDVPARGEAGERVAAGTPAAQRSHAHFREGARFSRSAMTCSKRVAKRLRDVTIAPLGPRPYVRMTSL